MGAVAIDAQGRVAAGTSTGGYTGKRPGRVGDSALIGAGTYADSRLGAVSTTGHGEAFIRTVLAKTALDILRELDDPRLAAEVALEIVRDEARGDGGQSCWTGVAAWRMPTRPCSCRWGGATPHCAGTGAFLLTGNGLRRRGRRSRTSTRRARAPGSRPGARRREPSLGS